MFSQIRNTLDKAMKDIAEKGIGVYKKQAEKITINEENQLWKKEVWDQVTLCSSSVPFFT